MTPSAAPPEAARVGRTRARKERRRALQKIERARRSATLLLVFSAAGLALLLSCSFGIVGFWCVPQPFQLIATIVLSSVAGLALGGTIRTYRDRRTIERDDAR
jgi:hypothetical protein